MKIKPPSKDSPKPSQAQHTDSHDVRHQHHHGHSCDHPHDHDHHNHDHKHDHDHGHHHLTPEQLQSNQKLLRAFKIGVTLNLIFVALEFYFGFITDSLALLADAGHNASDVIGLVLAWAALKMNFIKPTLKRTYGLKSTSILAALGNAVLLILAIGAILWESIQRFLNPTSIQAPTVIIVALIGVLINGLTAYFLHRDQDTDINIKGAYLHMVADALISLGVAASAGLYIFTKWNWIDPLVSVIVSLVILKSTWSLLAESFEMAIKAVPKNIDPLQVKLFLSSLPGVNQVHDLHIWSMSTTETALTVHLVMPNGSPGDDFLNQVTRELSKRFKINHSTIQIEQGERNKFKCDLEPEHVV